MRKSAAYCILAILSVAVVAGLAYAAFDKCHLCGMNIEGNENTAYEVQYQDGKSATLCCPHCGLWVHASEKAGIKQARARDFISGEWMDPEKMYFVFKSKAVPACAPSWIAFGKKAEAENFVKGFGGTVLSFNAAMKERLKHPKGMEM